MIFVSRIDIGPSSALERFLGVRNADRAVIVVKFPLGIVVQLGDVFHKCTINVENFSVFQPNPTSLLIV